jgi:hypothetical protein
MFHGTMPVRQQLPIPCPAHLIPDATDRFDAAYRAAKAQRAVFVGIEHEGEWWTVKADALTAGPDHVVDAGVNVALRAAIIRLARERAASSDAFAGPVFFMLHGVPSEGRARELAAAFHAALYGGLGPLRRAVPPVNADE